VGAPAVKKQRRRLPALRGRAALNLRRGLAVAAVVLATLAGGYGALATFTQEKDLSVGDIRLSMSPGHKGSLDIYVPLVDWGARFEAIRLPARLRIDLVTVDRQIVTKVANGAPLDVRDVRNEARDAIASYLMALLAVTALAALAFGLLVAFAIRSRTGPRLRWTSAAVVATTVLSVVALIVLLPPRGDIDRPQYYAHGADIPRALEAVDAAQQSSRVLDEELDAQLVGLARLVAEPAGRPLLASAPRLTIASDLHNNVLAVPLLGRAADDGPVLFAGDMTDRGSPLEAAAVRRVVRTGNPFVFVSGNHDSDRMQRELARDGAIVLTEDGRLKPDGTHGDVVNLVGGLRMAGYSDPFIRRSAENYADRFQPEPTPGQQDEFTSWLLRYEDDVDVVLVHEPKLIASALTILKDEPPTHPIVFVTGHTHKAELRRQPGVTVVNGGSIGGGGTGNLADVATDIGIARLVYGTAPFRPLAVDLVSIDPGSGSATARRERLDEPPGG
jgi:predicted phosphodiesterase